MWWRPQIGSTVCFVEHSVMLYRREIPKRKAELMLKLHPRHCPLVKGLLILPITKKDGLPRKRRIGGVVDISTSIYRMKMPPPLESVTPRQDLIERHSVSRGSSDAEVYRGRSVIVNTTEQDECRYQSTLVQKLPKRQSFRKNLLKSF